MKDLCTASCENRPQTSFSFFGSEAALLYLPPVRVISSFTALFRGHNPVQFENEERSVGARRTIFPTKIGVFPTIIRVPSLTHGCRFLFSPIFFPASVVFLLKSKDSGRRELSVVPAAENRPFDPSDRDLTDPALIPPTLEPCCPFALRFPRVWISFLRILQMAIR